jgi:hypothetical protein
MRSPVSRYCLALCKLGDEHDVAQGCQGAAEPDRGAVDRGDHRYRDVEHLVDEPPAGGHRSSTGLQVEAVTLELVQIAAGAEGLTGAREDDGSRVGGSTVRQSPSAGLIPSTGTAASAPSTTPTLVGPREWSPHWRSGGPIP